MTGGKTGIGLMTGGLAVGMGVGVGVEVETTVGVGVRTEVGVLVADVSAGQPLSPKFTALMKSLRPSLVMDAGPAEKPQS